MRHLSPAFLATLLALLALAAVPLQAQAPAPPAGLTELPDWLFPIDPNVKLREGEPPVKHDDQELLSVPGSAVSYTAARINDPFNPPDWRPNDHAPMPQIVAQGRKPHVMACALCHTPTGQGRPENAPLAGLPEKYLRQQLLDYRSGARRQIGPAEYLPNRNMHLLSKHLTDADIDESAKYFAQQKLRRRVFVMESLRIPRAELGPWIYYEHGGTEDLGERLLEVTQDLERHERRDDRLEYLAYVPPGSIARGKRLGTTGDGGRTQVCATCHGAALRGMNDVPGIAGRSPSYLLRQMLGFQHGARTTEVAKPMEPVVAKLEMRELIALAAWCASLSP